MKIDHKIRYKATEILFNPSIAEKEGLGIAELAFNAIEKCDPDLQISLYNNIVLAGGTTMLPGYKE